MGPPATDSSGPKTPTVRWTTLPAAWSLICDSSCDLRIHVFTAVIDVLVEGLWLSFDDVTDSRSRAVLELIAKPVTRCLFVRCPAVDVDHLESTLPELLDYPLCRGHSITEGVIIRSVCCRQLNETR